MERSGLVPVVPENLPCEVGKLPTQGCSYLPRIDSTSTLACALPVAEFCERLP